MLLRCSGATRRFLRMMSRSEGLRRHAPLEVSLMNAEGLRNCHDDQLERFPGLFQT